MSHHGHEDEVDRDHIRDLAAAANEYRSAVELIKAIANGLGTDGSRAHGGNYATTTPQQACDNWLERNGFECEASKRRQRELRAEQLDKEIERLRAERSRL